MPATETPNAPTVAVPKAPVHVGTITAVRAKEGLPTFALVAVQGTAPAVGASLRVVRNGVAHATLLTEAVSNGTLTARVTTWATGTQSLSVGDTVETLP